MALIDRRLHPAEVDLLVEALNELSDRIYNAKHNDRYHYGYRKNSGGLDERRLSDEGWHDRRRYPGHGPRQLVAKEN